MENASRESDMKLNRWKTIVQNIENVECFKHQNKYIM